MVHVQIDVRERDLIPRVEGLLALKNPNNLGITKCNLALGDIVLCDEDNNNKELVIIERKTVADLMSSIKDGRYDEQSYRLSGYDACHNHNIIYLIEGSARLKTDLDRTIYQSALFSVCYYKGFSVMHSTSLEDTAYIVCNMANKLSREMAKKKKTPYYSCLTNGESLDDESVRNSSADYCSVIKKVKKENITAQNITAIMLSQIPGVSSATATAVCQTYKTIFDLVFAIQENPACLDEICTTDVKTDKSRKISKTVRAKIVEYLGEL